MRVSEKKIYSFLEFCLWIFFPFLIVISILGQRIQPGLFLQWIGKMHPLIVHFPIVLGILIIVYFLFFQKRRFSPETEKLLLAINALFACITAIFGLLLSLQDAYDGRIIAQHKWGGVIISLMSWLFLYIPDFNKRTKKFLSILYLVVLVGSAHRGAQLTHGINALGFPRPTANQTEFNKTDRLATIYEAGIAPILEQKCISCHGLDKMKGNLQLNTPGNILKGGKSGDVLKGDLNKEAVLTERILLPLSDEKHMPPEGKSQLTSDEKKILTAWIRSGADLKTKLSEFPKEDSLYILVDKYILSLGKESFLPEDLPDLTEFNTNYCSVSYLFYGSGEAEVNFFQGSFYNRESLKKLEKIKENIVHLNMQGMALTKEDLDIIVQFKNLKKINLNYTGLGGGSLEVLKSLPQLNAVSLCGIQFDEPGLEKFLDRATFSSLNIWSDKISETELESLASKYPDVKITAGDNLENEIMKLSFPVIIQDTSFMISHLDVRIQHLLKGVDIRYTTDGSEPDSLTGSKYTNPVRLSDITVLKAKAFKTGWLGSDVAKRIFYKSGIYPDTLFLITSPDSKYRGNGAGTLVDRELGENNISNGKWLAYKDSDMEFIIGFNRPQPLKSLNINSFVDIGAYIFPVRSVTVKGSNDGRQFSDIAGINIPEAVENEPRGSNLYRIPFPGGTSFRQYKFKITNLKKLPEWHPGKGAPAWIFIDEIFLN